MKNHNLSDRGQVLIIFVFAIIGLIAMTGLAIDGSNIYSDRRHAQNAADTAVLAAALTRNNLEEAVQGANELDCTSFDLDPMPLCAARSINAALDMAATNGYTNNIVDSTVQVFSPPVDGPYADCYTGLFDCNEYIEVKIRTNVNTYFAPVLGITQLHNTVWAVALAQYDPETEMYGGNTLVQLGDTSHGCGGDFVLGGSGTVTLNGGGIFVNSDNPNCAFKETNHCVTLTLNPGPDGTVPGIMGVGGQFNSGCTNAPTMTHATTQYAFPPEHLIKTTPTECATAGTYTTGGGTTTYNPGSYGTFPVLNTKSVLNPGVYCVDKLQNNKDLTGIGVLIYMKPGGSVDLNGGTVKLTAPTSGTYEDIVIYGDWNNSSTVKTCSVNGGSADEYVGMILVPYCNLTINGNSSSTGYEAQIIAFQITLSGTSTLSFTYNDDAFPKNPEKNFTGLYH